MPPPASDAKCSRLCWLRFPCLWMKTKKRSLKQWVEEGSQLGDISDAQPTDALGTLDIELQNADLVMSIQEPYAPKSYWRTQPWTNEYRCFALATEMNLFILQSHPTIDRIKYGTSCGIGKGKGRRMVDGSKT